MVATDRVTPGKFYAPLIPQGLVWVAVDGGTPIGFAYGEVFGDELHLWELAVRLRDQRRGAGRLLVEAVAAAARARDLKALTLTTFRDIAWNAPFYARLGFREVAQEEPEPRLMGLREKEAAMGLDVANRCAMRLAL